MRDVSSRTVPTGQAPTKPAKNMPPVDDQSDFLATDCDRRITETMPVELPRYAPEIYGIGITEPHDLEALAWACGIGPEEASILAAPAAEPGARFAKDRAAVVTTAILQIVRDELTAWAHREPANIAGVHEAIESFLRDEFDAHARATLNEIRLNDE